MQCPIYKGKGRLSEMNNYRGISIGSTLGKLFSSVSYYRLQNWAETQKVRAYTQSGFRTSHGPLDSLITLILRVLNEKQDVDFWNRILLKQLPLLCTCLIDFQKAFDSCDRQKIIENCKQLGFYKTFLDWSYFKWYTHTRFIIC